MKEVCTVEHMKNTPEAERLAKAINSLARVIAGIITERVQRLEAELNDSPLRSADPILNKKELAQRLHVGVRTVTSWMATRKIPYMKLGGAVRFRWSEVEQSLQRFQIRSRY